MEGKNKNKKSMGINDSNDYSKIDSPDFMFGKINKMKKKKKTMVLRVCIISIHSIKTCK